LLDWIGNVSIVAKMLKGPKPVDNLVIANELVNDDPVGILFEEIFDSNADLFAFTIVMPMKITHNICGDIGCCRMVVPLKYPLTGLLLGCNLVI
jgi:hypothetical protein